MKLKIPCSKCVPKFQVPAPPPSLIRLCSFFSTLQEAQLSCSLYKSWLGYSKMKRWNGYYEKGWENLDLRWRPRKVVDWVCMEKTETRMHWKYATLREIIKYGKNLLALNLLLHDTTTDTRNPDTCSISSLFANTTSLFFSPNRLLLE